MPSKKDDSPKKEPALSELSKDWSAVQEKISAPKKRGLSEELSHDMAVLRAREHRSLMKVLDAILAELDRA